MMLGVSNPDPFHFVERLSEQDFQSARDGDDPPLHNAVWVDGET
jgi:hypothetical protein